MLNRRDFLRTGAMASTGLLLAPEILSAYKPKYIGLQLYTVRDLMAKEPVLTLARVSEIGFNCIETATYTGSQRFYGMDAANFKRVLSDNDLHYASGHYLLGESMPDTKGTISNGWEKAVEDAHEAGLKYMVCAYLMDAERGTLDHYKQTADKLNRAGEIAKQAGIQLCYHNHDFEFIAQDGKLPYDVLLSSTDKELVKMELDLYWVYKAKQDPIALFNANPGRFPLWHVKDMDNTAKQDFTEVGNGVIPFKNIFAQQKTAGLKYFFNEQDKTPGDPMVSITQSFKYIKKNLV